jgi:S1-C subfamily serine protease
MSPSVWIVVETGLEKGHAAECGEDGVTIGSGAGCALTLSDPDVAPLHASVRCAGGVAELVRLDLHGKLTVDGEPVTGTVELEPGARVGVADVELSLRERAPSDPDPELDPDLAAALGSDGPHADDELTPARERRRLRRATALAAVAVALAVAAGALALTGVIGGGDGQSRADVAEIVRDASDQTVRIIARDLGQEASGSGWVLDAREGLIVTNFHVVNGASEFAITVDGAERTAELVGAAPCDDLAVLSVSERDGLQTLDLAESGSIEQGESVVAVGFAAGAGDADELTSTTGVVSVPSQPLRAPSPDAPDFRDVLQTDAAINPGNSGGPLLDEDRNLVGVNTAVLLERGGVPLQNIGYAIGVDRVRDVVSELRRKRSMSWFGTGLEFPSPAALRRRGLPPGVATLGAVDGTPAADAGLKRQTVLITKVDGRRMDGSMRGWCKATEDKRSGDEVELDVADRRGKRERVSIRMA